MKTYIISAICLAIVPFPAMQSAFGIEHDKDVKGSQGARISKDAVKEIARTQLPNSAFESAKLEKENGRLIWSIDLRSGGSNRVEGVHVDAATGSIVAADNESPKTRSSDSGDDAYGT